jgi:hypothetical protein
LVYLDETGQVFLNSDAPGADQDKFDAWLAGACVHGPMGELVSHRLGNIALIGFLRALLSETPERFPVLLTKVIYDGTHCCDFLTLCEVNAVGAELGLLQAVHANELDYENLIRQFERQMLELVAAAQLVGKPIVF